MERSRKLEVIYLAGGCFWGIESYFSKMKGVADAMSGYANGHMDHAPTYQEVCTDTTGFRETVKVEYHLEEVSLDALLFAFFSLIDVSAVNRQGHDTGSQYQAGIYYQKEETRQTIERIAEIIKERYPDFHVEIEPLRSFYPAEDYHQDYLEKNPDGYCHISLEQFYKLGEMCVDPGKYPRPSMEKIKEMLTPEQYRVVYGNGTELAGSHEYDTLFEPGIYVDVVTGEPLFSSEDKFSCGCGWPAFSKPVDPNVLIELRDESHGMVRVEVRSRAGNCHLGHRFDGEGISPTNVRYCINGAALKFIPAKTL